MATIEEQIASQIANIEHSTGRSMAEWIEVVRASGLDKHAKVVAMLKAEHGLGHGNANRIAIQASQADAGGAPSGEDLVASQYAGRNEPLRPAYDAVVALVRGFGKDVELAPKKAYVSLRRRKQFGQVDRRPDSWRSVSTCRAGSPPSASPRSPAWRPIGSASPTRPALTTS